ncbi:MAG: type II toxin-antitoxin system HicB family antitoxin [Candidatus Accumulibacter sp.]|jgi:predicted HicB family RNase H-like nuclease|uniref:Type II toxin-antitoxin system HicB family antitoxin n=1 Tax=Candidatus Accumulibacter proximus TaxID=2954385 RepID=A0A935PY86_9PROT|nr:type II toxin-antitoxin system HicB family antitoxin [Candidatus Accumulibacter proximus]MBL8407596.1 type II toxin-antitoxin system HicB family antitoxin [Accumulibacter sp.]
MKNTMDFKGYTGSVEYSDEDGIFFGKVQFIRALISYEGSNAEELRKDFHDGVDDYLAMCKEKNITPEQPFKGSFNVRVGRDLHRQIAIEAARRGVSLNSLIVTALEKETHHAA